MPGLGFLAPWFLAGALLAGVPLLLHLFRREQAQPTAFSAVQFVSGREVRQARRRQPSDLILLLLRVAAIVLLAVAFARPWIGTGAAGAADRPTVVALDVSASLSAPGSFARARGLAREAVGAAGPGPVGLVAYDEAARVVVPPVADRAAALRAIDALQPTIGSTDHASALRTSVQLFGGVPGTVVLVTDRQAPGGAAVTVEAPAGSAFELREVATPRGNLAVSDVRLRNGLVAALVQNTGDRERRTRVTLEVDGRRAGEVERTVPAGGVVPLNLPVPPGAASMARVAIIDGEGMALDDERWAMLEAPAPLAVLIVGGEDVRSRPGYLQRALGAAVDEQDRATVAVTVRAGEAPELRDARRLAEYGAVAVLATRGLDHAAGRALRDYVAGGGGLLIVAGPGTAPQFVRELTAAAVMSTAGGAEWPATLAVTDPRHPLVVSLGTVASQLSAVRVDRGLQIAPADGTRAGAVLSFTNGLPALVETQEQGGRVLLLASGLDREWSDLPRHAAFPPLALELVRYLAGPTDRRQEVPVGELPTPVPARAGTLTTGTPPRRVVVNVAPRESGAETIDAEVLRAMFAASAVPALDAVRAGTVDGEARQRGWRTVLAVMLGVLVLESTWAARRARQVVT